MFFTYPIQAIADNRIHDCIYAALTSICRALDANQAVPEWPNLIPAAHRKLLEKKRSLPRLLKTFEGEAAKLTQADRADFLEKFLQQNQIIGLLDGSANIPVFNDVLLPLLSVTKEICEEGFLLLSKMDIRSHHYKIIYDHIRYKTCPFCGTEPFDSPELLSEDEDHYLARSIYPLAAANFANLVPMGAKCNQRYKGTEDILHFNGARRKALNPYGQVCADISLLNSIPEGGLKGKPDWQIAITPDIEEVHTWESVFLIRERLKNSVLDPHFDDWISELPDWFSVANVDDGVDDNSLVDELEKFVAYKFRHREQGASFFKGKVFEFLTHQFKQGNAHVITMIRSSLPKATANA